MKPLTHICYTLFLALLASSPAAAQEIVYVDAAATGANNGTSWPDAYTDLQSALDRAAVLHSEVEGIRVAQGTYVPTEKYGFSFVGGGVALFGGYGGSRSAAPDARLSSHPTILSGDRAADDVQNRGNIDDNAYIVVLGVNLAQDTVIDGFTFTRAVPGGFVSGSLALQNSAPLVRNCRFVANNANLASRPVVAGQQGFCGCGGAGGVTVFWSGSPRFESCRFEANLGAMNICSGKASLTRCEFYANSADCGPAILVGGAQVTIEHCIFQGNFADLYGGAIGTDSYPTAEIVIGNSSFVGNVAAHLGGAINTYAPRTLRISDSYFRENTCERFGAGAVSSAYSQALEVRRSVFDFNQGGHGAAMAVSTSDWAPGQSTTIEDCDFSSNTASEEGGAIYADDWAPQTGDRTLEIRGCRFQRNWASEGGAIALSRREPSLIAGCEFDDNLATVGGAVSAASGSIVQSVFRRNHGAIGGAISAVYADGAVRIVNSLLAQNVATAFGGAIAAGSGGLEFSKCTIVGNIAEGGGGGVFAGYDVVMDSSILWNNALVVQGEKFVDQLAQLDVMGFATVQDNTVQNWTPSLGGVGNNGIDPMFVVSEDSDGLDGGVPADFHLLPASLAIDSGDPDYIAEPGETDLDGKPRVLCGRVDRGAYEFGVVGDIDCDRAVTLADFHEWPVCETGPGEPIALGDCQALDAHTDGLIDLHDFAGFQNAIGSDLE